MQQQNKSFDNRLSVTAWHCLQHVDTWFAQGRLIPQLYILAAMVVEGVQHVTSGLNIQAGVCMQQLSLHQCNRLGIDVTQLRSTVDSCQICLGACDGRHRYIE